MNTLKDLSTRPIHSVYFIIFVLLMFPAGILLWYKAPILFQPKQEPAKQSPVDTTPLTSEQKAEKPPTVYGDGVQVYTSESTQKRKDLGVTTDGRVIYIRSASTTAPDSRVFSLDQNGREKELLDLKEYGNPWFGRSSISPRGRFVVLAMGGWGSDNCCNYAMHDLVLNEKVEWFELIPGDKVLTWSPDESFAILNTSPVSFGDDQEIPDGLYIVRFADETWSGPEEILSFQTIDDPLYGTIKNDAFEIVHVYLQNPDTVSFAVTDSDNRSTTWYQYDINERVLRVVLKEGFAF